MQERTIRGIIIFMLLCAFICYHTLSERQGMRSSDNCFKEKHSFIQTEVKAANTTFTYSKCLEQDGENKGLLSYFVPENFISFKCPKVDVHFNKVNLPRVALASFPGSGNTWLRHLIEKMSGIATGSVYCGTKEMQSTFIGQCKKNNSRTILVKTHELSGKTSNEYDKAVLIIRNPFDALLAEFNRQHSGKTLVASKQSFLSKQWTDFVKSGILRWKKHIYSWLTIFTGKKHIVFYEHLQDQLIEELIMLSAFLHTNSTISDIWCTVQDQEGLFHREKPEWFVVSSLFTNTMKATVQSEIDELYKLMTTNAVPSEARKNFDLLYRKK